MVVALRRQHPVGRLVELEPRQHVLVAGAAARVLVHVLDQLGDRAPPVADHMAGHPARGGDELAVDHQQPVVVALDHALDHDARCPRRSRSRRRPPPRRRSSGSPRRRGRGCRRPASPPPGSRCSSAASTASSASRTWSCFGTGRPRSESSRVQSSLSEAISTAVCEVWLVSAASMRFWYLPWPTWIRLASFSRTQGMSRASAARTSASADGPSDAAAGEMVEVGDRLGDVDGLVLARGDQLEDDATAPPRRPRARPPRTRSRRAPRPRLRCGRGPGHRDVGRGAGTVLQRDGDLRHQLAEPAVRLVEPLGEAARRARSSR